MAKNGKNSSVPTQKGPLNADQRTMKHEYRKNIDKQDAKERDMRFDGQCIYRTHIPKQ